jgi:hypothetical protein
MCLDCKDADFEEDEAGASQFQCCCMFLLSPCCCAVGCATLGQLLVWEWRSETYVLKQQGHHHDIATAAFSPDGSIIATGSDDRKVRRHACDVFWCGEGGGMPHTSTAVHRKVVEVCYDAEQSRDSKNM